MGQQLNCNSVVIHELWTIHNNLVLDLRRQRQTSSKHKNLPGWFLSSDFHDQVERCQLGWYLQNLLRSCFKKLRNCQEIFNISHHCDYIETKHCSHLIQSNLKASNLQYCVVEWLTFCCFCWKTSWCRRGHDNFNFWKQWVKFNKFQLQFKLNWNCKWTCCLHLHGLIRT